MDIWTNFHFRLLVLFFFILDSIVFDMLWVENTIMKYLSYCGIYTTRGKYRFAVLFFACFWFWMFILCQFIIFSSFAWTPWKISDITMYNVGRVKRIWYLSPMQAAKVQASLRIRAVSPEPPLLAHTSSESRGIFRQKARSLAPLNGWACSVKICNDGMLEDTNSLDGAQCSKEEKSELHTSGTTSTCIIKHLIHVYRETSFYMSQLMRLWYVSHRRPAKAQASLRIRAVSPEPSLFAHMKYGPMKNQTSCPAGWLCTCIWRMLEWVYGRWKVP